LITRACEIYDFAQKEKPNLGYKNFVLFGGRYSAQTPGISYLDDIPFLSNTFYENNDARTLSDNYYLLNDPIIEFNLYYIYCQLHRNLGRIGSAYKTLEKLVGCLNRTEKVNPKVAYETQVHENLTRYEDLTKAKTLIQREFLIPGRSGFVKEKEDDLIYDLKKYGVEVFLYSLAKITLAFYLGNFNEVFSCIVETLGYLTIIHKWKLTEFDYKKSALFERELVSITSEAMVKYAQNTLSKEIIDIALYRIDIALNVKF